MGKHGPCHHCGVKSTPLWRNGPPEKPVLCNACGSRWRTKGTLANYTPLHARMEPNDFEDNQVPTVKTISIKTRESKISKRKYDKDLAEFGGFHLDYNQGLSKVFEEDTSNRSSSGSAISNSESCVQYGSADASDLTGPSQPIICDSMVPSKKRTCIARSKPSPIEKLTKDLYTIWYEQQSSCLSGSSEELLVENNKAMVSVEIGHGSVLINHPNSIGREEESEASSFSVHNKHRIVKSQQPTFPGFMEETGIYSSSRGFENIKKPASPRAEQEPIKRDKDQLEKLRILAHHGSPLCYINLHDVLNFDNFLSHLTNDEQQQLLKLVQPVDFLESTASVKSMFESPQFKENLSSFQELLSDGIFDNSSSGIKMEDCRILKRYILFNLKKSKWVEMYQSFKEMNGMNYIKASEVAEGSSARALAPDYSCTKNPQDGHCPKFSGSVATMACPGSTEVRPINAEKVPLDNDISFFNSKFLSSLPNVYGSSLLDSCFPEQNLLLDVPSNTSFPQAELLVPKSSFVAQASTSSSSVYPNLFQQ